MDFIGPDICWQAEKMVYVWSTTSILLLWFFYVKSCNNYTFVFNRKKQEITGWVNNVNFHFGVNCRFKSVKRFIQYTKPLSALRTHFLSAWTLIVAVNAVIYPWTKSAQPRVQENRTRERQLILLEASQQDSNKSFIRSVMMKKTNSYLLRRLITVD